MLEVDGVLRHRLNSNGMPIHHTDEGIRNFWRWFGSSKVVDDGGRPLIVYHGTWRTNGNQLGLSEFSKLSHFGTSKAANDRLAHTDTKDGYVLPLILTIKKPLIINKDYIHWSNAFQFATKLKKDGYLSRNDLMSVGNMPNSEGLNYVVEILSEKGYDGVLYKNSVEDKGSQSYIIFGSDQIKSAIGNSGVFSQDFNNICDDLSSVPSNNASADDVENESSLGMF